MPEQKFPDGLYVNAPRDNAPDFVKGSIAIDPAKFLPWLQEQGPTKLYLDIKEGRSGKWYASVSSYTPKTQATRAPSPEEPPPFTDDEISF